MKKFVFGLLLAAVAVPAVPAMAQSGRSWADEQREEDARANHGQDRGRWNDSEGYRNDDRYMLVGASNGLIVSVILRSGR